MALPISTMGCGYGAGGGGTVDPDVVRQLGALAAGARRASGTDISGQSRPSRQ